MTEKPKRMKLKFFQSVFTRSLKQRYMGISIQKQTNKKNHRVIIQFDIFRNKSLPNLSSRHQKLL